jgi:hypothetical protein
VCLRYLVPLLCAAQGQLICQAPHDSVPTYASPALQTLVERASRRNTVVPAGLVSYQVIAESELSLVVRRPDGTEGATQVEETESRAQWARTGAFAQHLIGYRSQLSGPNISALAFIKQAWIVPVLYGNRLGLFLGRDTTRTARRAIARDTAVRVVHPFALDRDSVYRFAGGDTALKLSVLGRTIPVAVVHVTPRPGLFGRTVVFRGDVYVDMNDAAIVRLRGAFETVGGHRHLAATLQGVAYRTAAFVDLTNRQVAGRYWLPDVQRIEAEVSSPFLGDTRSIFRIVTHFRPYTLNDTTVTAALVAAGQPVPRSPQAGARPGSDSIPGDTALVTDTLRVLPHLLSIAPSDSLLGFSEWQQPIGLATRAVRDSDFNDVAPDPWRTTGPPRVEFGAQRLGEFVHFDRVEGLFTGAGASIRFRDAAPGVTLRGNAGWAWTEGTARGGASLEWQRSPWLVGVQASRYLDITNDFTTVFTSGPFLEALFLQDNYDYVDRRSATVYALREWLAPASGSRFVVRLEAGPGSDAGVRALLTHGIFPPSVFMSDSLFRPNRNVLPGSYFQSAVTVAFNPGIDAGFVGDGIGVRLRAQAAVGQLAWDRVEARVSARQTVGPFTLLGRVDAGVVEGSVIPPQQMFEIGSVEGLLAYDYKQFAGNEAATWQGEGQFALPFWHAPVRVGGFIFPSPSPALALGLLSGWTDVTTLAARRALVALGDRVDPKTDAVIVNPFGMTIPVSLPTVGIPTSLSLLVRFFGGAAGVGITRSLAPGAHFQPVFRLGAAL